MAFFNPRFKNAVHACQVILVITVLGVSLGRIIILGGIKSRADTMALSMGAKSIIVMLYQILTEHVKSCRRWASLKANTILNAMEIVFWAAVAFLVIQAMSQSCSGTGCTMSWIIVVLAISLSIVAAYAAGTSYVEFRESRKAKSSHEAVWPNQRTQSLETLTERPGQNQDVNQVYNQAHNQSYSHAHNQAHSQAPTQVYNQAYGKPHNGGYGQTQIQIYGKPHSGGYGQANNQGFSQAQTQGYSQRY